MGGGEAEQTEESRDPGEGGRGRGGEGVEPSREGGNPYFLAAFLLAVGFAVGPRWEVGGNVGVKGIPTGLFWAVLGGTPRVGLYPRSWDLEGTWEGSGRVHGGGRLWGGWAG